MLLQNQLFKHNVTLNISASNLFLDGEIVCSVTKKACFKAILIA